MFLDCDINTPDLEEHETTVNVVLSMGMQGNAKCLHCFTGNLQFLSEVFKYGSLLVDKQPFHKSFYKIIVNVRLYHLI